MARIYENSLCTIIAPSSDPTEPLFIEREATLVRPAVLQLSPLKGGPSAAVRFHPVLPKWKNGTLDSPCESGEPELQGKQPTRKRAWCLQEYELSRRTVTFTTHQFLWACKEMQCSEERFSDLSRPLSWYGLKKNRWEKPIYRHHFMEPPGQSWEKLVEEFTSRDITRMEDRLPAMSGLAQKMQQKTRDTYHAGLWEKNLKNELLWQVRDEKTCSRIGGIPSWSWAAVTDAVHFPLRPYDRSIWEKSVNPTPGDEIVIEDVKVEVDGENSFGRVKSGRITLQGHLFKALVGIPGTGSRPMRQLRSIGNNPPIPNDFDLGFVFFDDF